MTMTFRRRVGAAADLAELEYIIALHQTSTEIRESATISSRDVVRYLKSRYMLTITHKQAIEVVRSLAGGDTVIDEAEDKKLHKENGWRLFKSSESIHTTQQRTNASQRQSATGGMNGNEYGDSWCNGRSEPMNGSAGPSAASGGKRRIHDSQSDNGEDLPGELLDLVQVLSVILIPTMARIADEFKNGPHPEPYVEDTNVRYTFLRPFTNWIDQIRRWRARREYALYDRLRPEPRGKGPTDLKLLWLDRVGMSNLEVLPEVNEDFVKKLLLEFGEFERARNPVLIREMVQAAQSTTGCLNEEAVMKAISSDLKDWEVGCEDKCTTFFNDVFGTPDHLKVMSLEAEEPTTHQVDVEEINKDTSGSSNDSSDGATEQCCHSSISCFCSWTWWVLTIFWLFGYCSPKSGALFNVEPSNVDMVIDAHYSRFVLVLVWIFTILSFAMYFSLVSALPPLPCGNLSSFWCILLDTIYKWAIVGISSCFFGIVFTLPLSVGNNPFRRDPCHIMAGFLVSFSYAIIPYAAVKVWQQLDDNWQESMYGQLIDGSYAWVFQTCILVIGCILSGLLVFHLVGVMVCKKEKKSLIPCSNDLLERNLKWAATRKLNLMLTNAHSLHKWNHPLGSGPQSNNQQVLSNYMLRGEGFEIAGGLFWTWRHILNGTLFDTEGIWIASRLLWVQVAQVMIGVMTSWFLFEATKYAANSAAKAHENMDPSVPEWYKESIPTSYMMYASLYPASIVATVMMGLIILFFIPSAVALILKFRCQIYPSLGSPRFHLYRSAVDLTYMNSSNALWGLVGTASLFFLIVGLIVFLFLYPQTQDFMLRLLGWCLGVGVTVMAKMVISHFYRNVQYRCFYRIQPQAAAVTSLAMECWYIAVGGSFLLCRIGVFLLAAAFWVGRVDCQFLSDDVSLLGYQFDYAPSYFVKDLLVHEAHRHPYLERLGQMYLMKLRHRNFVNNAGTVWRQLAVMALFPWLTKHRVFDKAQQEKAAERLECEQLHHQRENELRRGRRLVIDPDMLGGTIMAESVRAGETEVAINTPRSSQNNIRRKSVVRYGSSEIFRDCESEEFADALG